MDPLAEADAQEIAHALGQIRIGRIGPLLGAPHGPQRRQMHHRQGAHGGRHSHHRAGPRGAAAVRALLAIHAAGHPLSVGEIGAEIGVDQPRASRLVAQGVEEGLLVRDPDPQDSRRLNVGLTSAGRTLAVRILQSRTAQVERALQGFDAEERRDLVRLLKRLADNWDQNQLIVHSE